MGVSRVVDWLRSIPQTYITPHPYYIQAIDILYTADIRCGTHSYGIYYVLPTVLFEMETWSPPCAYILLQHQQQIIVNHECRLNGYTFLAHRLFDCTGVQSAREVWQGNILQRVSAQLVDDEPLGTYVTGFLYHCIHNIHTLTRICDSLRYLQQKTEDVTYLHRVGWTPVSAGGPHNNPIVRAWHNQGCYVAFLDCGMSTSCQYTNAIQGIAHWLRTQSPSVHKDDVIHVYMGPGLSQRLGDYDIHAAIKDSFSPNDRQVIIHGVYRLDNDKWEKYSIGRGLHFVVETDMTPSPFPDTRQWSAMTLLVLPQPSDGPVSNTSMTSMTEWTTKAGKSSNCHTANGKPMGYHFVNASYLLDPVLLLDDDDQHKLQSEAETLIAPE